MRLIMFNDEPVVAEALTGVLQRAKDIQLLRSLRHVSEVVPAVLEEQPEILLLCVTPETQVCVIRQLRQASPNCRIVLWIHSISNELAHHAMAMGVSGILRRTHSPQLLLKCLRKVHEGEMWFDRFLISSFMACRKVRLTRREGQLVRLLATGLKNKEIANTLSITEGTVKVYLSRLFSKVGAKDRYELALFSLRNLQGFDSTPRADGGVDDELRILYVESQGTGQPERKPVSQVSLYRTAAAGVRRLGPT
jgi:DNA-binding NarL/FixJ family response regulator